MVPPDLLKAQFYSYLSNTLNYSHIYTDGSKAVSGVAAAAISNTMQLACRLPSEASIFTAEAQAISLALKIVESSCYRNFYIFSDSMSCLQAISYRKFENPDILRIIEEV